MTVATELKTLRHRLGLDRAIAYTILARLWSSSAGLITVAMIARFLSAAEQGYYYTFWSLVALQIVFELGFSFVILQLASHESAHLSISSDCVVSGDPVALARLASVFQKALLWYSIAGALLLCILAPAGLYFFGRHAQPGMAIAWRRPWCAVAVAAALNFQLDPIIALLEGCGYVTNIARLRLAQAIAGSLLAWAVLATHHGLFAPAMMVLGTGSASIAWLWGKRRLLLALLRYKAGEHRIDWRWEVWPFQWRIAVSWMCGYFIYQIFTPVLFAIRGPVVAGQMGMSLSLAGAIQAVAVSWISTKSAPFGAMIARKQYALLDGVFFRALWQSTFICSLGAAAIWLGAIGLHAGQFAFARRLLSPSVLGLLLLATIANNVVSGEALYLRAHKQEKFLWNSVLTALLVGSSTHFLGGRFGAAGMVGGYLAILLLVSLSLGTHTLLKYRRIWHEA